MDASQYEGNFPIMDVLVIVHCDNLDPNEFVRLQVESRTREYLDQGRKVYNLSTSNNPTNDPNINNIASPIDDPDGSNYFGLDRQVNELLRELGVEDRELSVEINGVVFYICVYRAFKGLEKEPLINPEINYDCSDSVGHYWIFEGKGLDHSSHTLGTFDGESMHIPIPSPIVLEKYKQHLKKFPKS